MNSPIVESSSDRLEDHIVPVESSPVRCTKCHDCLDDEPILWFGRFQAFLLQGRERSVRAAYRNELQLRSHGGGRRRQAAPESATCGVPESWRIAVRRWDWYARAASYDLELLEQEKQQIEADRNERRRLLIEQEWTHGQQMVTTASVALSHGDKFFSRRVVEKPSRYEIDPITGEKIRIVERVVFLELKVGDINRMIMDGGKKMGLSVGMSSEKAQEDFSVEQSKPAPMDTDAVDLEIFEMFEALGANKPVPQPTDNPGA